MTTTQTDTSAVNSALTANRPTNTTVENDAYAAFAARVVRAHGRRVAHGGDVDALADLLTLAQEIDRAVHTAVTGLRAFGYSWAEIAARLDITRQAAQQRWGGSP
jgi:hypothetical protein